MESNRVLKFLVILLILVIIILLLLFIQEKQASNDTEKDLQGIFGSYYLDSVREIRHLADIVSNETTIPPESSYSREGLITSIALMKYSGKQLTPLVSKEEAGSIHSILIVFRDLEYSLRHNEFSNFCYLSEDRDETVNGLEGYLYLLDNLTIGHGTGEELYQNVITTWKYDVYDLDSRCSFKYGI